MSEKMIKTLIIGWIVFLGVFAMSLTAFFIWIIIKLMQHLGVI